MSLIPTRGTAPELALRAALERLRAGPVAANDPGLPGSPDAVLPAHRAVLFAHGCFWHHHPGCPCARVPGTTYPWADKFRRNRARDEANRDALLRAGWRVAWVWECALTGRHALPRERLDTELGRFLAGQPMFHEVVGAGVRVCQRP